MAKYDRIKDLREDSDKTQQELADYLCTSSQHYGKYELGHAEIPFERAIALAKYYGVSLDYIAGLTNSKRGLSHGEVTPEHQKLLNALNSLSKDERSRAEDFLQTLLDAIKI